MYASDEGLLLLLGLALFYIAGIGVAKALIMLRNQILDQALDKDDDSSFWSWLTVTYYFSLMIVFLLGQPFVRLRLNQKNSSQLPPRKSKLGEDESLYLDEEALELDDNPDILLRH